MNVTTFLNTLAIFLTKFYPEQLDPTLKPIDSSTCTECRKYQYDFIIVGAGTAGSVLANRLSANPNWKILLLEAGNDEDYITDTPAMTSILFGTKYDWNFTTVKQHHSCFNSGGYCHYSAGHVMGGTSTINGMDYVRGNPQDYDEWETLGNPGWNYKDVLPYFLRAENTTIKEFSRSSYHSTDGEQTVGYSRFSTEISENFIKTVKENGVNEIDYNGREQIGISRLQFTIRGAVRCSTAKAYLNPIRHRKNLIIYKNTKVLKILFNDESPKKAIGVSCRTNGEQYDVYATKEIVLSAGFINTPKLLMLSGIGPKKHLEELDIPVIADLPVGNNLQDHSGISMKFTVNKSTLNCCSEYNDEDIYKFTRDREGALTSPSQQIIAFLNTNNRTNKIPDITIIMGIISKQFTNQPDPYIFIYIGNIKPKTVGTIRLNSNNPDEQPLIDPNYFAVQSDMQSIRHGIYHVLNYTKSTYLQKYSIKWVNNIRKQCNSFLNPLSVNNLNCYIRHNAIAGFHGVGTAKMGPKTDRTSVVNSMLNVHNLEGLRIVDASIMPKIIRGNTNAAVIMIAEKAADLINHKYNTKSL